MYPLHPGHIGHELMLIMALAIVVVTAAFALTRDGWSRVGALVGVAAIAVIGRTVIEIFGIHAHNVLHLAAHGLELSIVVMLALAGYYAFDTQMSTPSDSA